MSKQRSEKKKKGNNPNQNFFPNENKLNHLKSGKKIYVFGIKKPLKQQNKNRNTMFLSYSVSHIPTDAFDCWFY